MRDIEQEQIHGSTDTELADRLQELKQRYDPFDDGGQFPGGGYPMDRLRELHLIQQELSNRRGGL